MSDTANGCSSPRVKTSAGVGRKRNLDGRLSLYALAAGATATGVLALAQTADAKVVYTATNVGVDGSLFIDLNNDGISDFLVKEIRNSFFGYCFDLLVAGKGPSIIERYGFAERLSFGAEIAQSDRFAAVLDMVDQRFGVLECYASGPWNGTGFLGLRFPLRDGVHYGWASFTVDRGGPFATLTGYAYETVPGKAIKAGQTHSTSSITDNEDVGEMRPSTLGALAAGAQGVDVWRREGEGPL